MASGLSFSSVQTRFSPCVSLRSLTPLISVSYTHLDVYKRQPEHCAACTAALAADAKSQAYTGWDEIDIAPPVEGRIGLMFSVTRHLLLETECTCGHVSRAQPWRAPPDSQWGKVELGEWRLVGPQLAGILVFLHLRMRLSRARIREELMELFGLLLSTGVIDEAIREAGRASFPLEDVLVADIIQAPLLNVCLLYTSRCV